MTTKVQSNADGSSTILNGVIEAIKIDAAGKVSMPQLPFTDSPVGGYFTLPNGLIIQWGFNSTPAGGILGDAPFPKPFPNGAMQMVATPNTSNILIAVSTFNLAAYTVFANARTDGAGVAADFRWIAIGY